MKCGSKPEFKRAEPPSFRRRFNQSFENPDGSYSLQKIIVVTTQVGILNHLMIAFDNLIDKPEALLIILAFLIAPQIIKQAIVLKLGGTNPK